MRKFVCLIAVVCVAVITNLAGPQQDVRIQTENDPDRNVVFKIVNVSDKNVRAKVQHTKSCNSTTTRQSPTEREYWLSARHSKRLRKVQANSDCRHTYRVVSAEYY